METLARFSRVTLPPSTPPLMVVVVDTEEEFEWSEGFNRANLAVQNMREQWRSQAILERFGIKPTYAIDWAVLQDDYAKGWLNDLLASDSCEIGAHMHPWVTPPFREDVTARNSYAGNLPPALERDKILALVEEIDRHLETAPIAYKAGRYGFGPATAGILQEVGITIDLSVVPHTSFRKDGGPSFYRFPDGPYWHDEPGGLMEVPVTTSFSGALRQSGAKVAHLLDTKLSTSTHLPGALARLGMLERIRLTPEDTDHRAHKRLIRAMLNRGERVFTFSYHSSTLALGHTPYVQSNTEREAFLSTIERTLEWFSGDVGGRFMTLSELNRLARQVS